MSIELTGYHSCWASKYSQQLVDLEIIKELPTILTKLNKINCNYCMNFIFFTM